MVTAGRRRVSLLLVVMMDVSLVPADAGRSCKGGFGTNAEARQVAKKIHKKDTMLRVSRTMMVEDKDPRMHPRKSEMHDQPCNCNPALLRAERMKDRVANRMAPAIRCASTYRWV